MYLEPCTADQLIIIYADIDVDEESIRRDVRLLMEWTDEHPHLPKITNDEWLQQFLFRSKNNLDKAKAMIETYYKSRTEMPELFDCRDPCAEDFKNAKDVAILFPVPKLTQDGYRLVFTDWIAESAVHQVKPNALLQFYQMHSDLVLKTDVHRGLIFVNNMANISFGHVKLIFVILRRLVKMQMKLSPIRFHKIYIVNMSFFTRPLLQLTKKLISKKLADRIVCWHKPLDELNTIFPEECLPKECGGILQSYAELNEEWYNCLVEYREWFKNDTESIGRYSKEYKG